MQAISRVRHTDKYKCLLMCIEREKSGYECVQPMRLVDRYMKDFKNDGRHYDFAGISGDGFWEAVYKREME